MRSGSAAAKSFDTTLEFAKDRIFVYRRRTAIIYVHRKRVAATRCPGLWFVIIFYLFKLASL